MLQIRNLSYVVESDKQAKTIIKDVNLEIENNSLVVITGPNGSGKSTLAKLIAGIATPTEGSIIFKGQDITSLSITERAHLGIGFAFQQPIRFKGLTVKDLISIAAGRPLSTSDVCFYLAEVGLCANDYVERELNSSLSGGELKRIEIATLLARKPILSLFDEPEAGIDLWSFHNLIRVFGTLREITGGSFVIISHQERILEIADKIVVLTEGQISRIGSKDEIMPYLLETSLTCDYFKSEGLTPSRAAI